MIITILSFIYIFIICFLLGLLIRKGLQKIFDCRIESADAVTVCGLAAATVYAEIWSIFAGVSLAANAVLVLICILSAVLFGKELGGYIKKLLPMLPVIAILAVLFAALSSDVPTDYDTYLYHAQAIQWIERYGLVPGLGNLHNRFGYNSAFMCLQALFSFGFTGRSLHQMNGFLCLFTACFVCLGDNIFKKKKTEAEDLIKLSAVCYIVYVARSISSSGSDIMAMLLLLWLFARWCALVSAGEKRPAPYGLLCLLSFVLCTVKLSVMPAVLLSIYPIYLLIKEKKAGQIIKYVIAGIVIFLPYIIRNILITGYLVYPMESLDIFGFDWKVPAEVSITDRTDIVNYGRSINGMEGAFSLSGWLQVWFRSLEFVPRLIFCVAVFGLIVFIIILIRYILKKEGLKGAELFTAGIAGINFIYWLLSSPLMRYGIVIVLLFGALIFGLFLGEGSKRAYMAFLAVSAAFMLFSYTDEFIGKEINLVWPEDYSTFECREVILEGADGDVTIYTPVESDQSGVDVFPATPEINPDYTELRGSGLKDGFRAIKR